jgi:hypothetical protein
MKTVQMTLDEQLVKAVDSAARKLGTTRSGFTSCSSEVKTASKAKCQKQHLTEARSCTQRRPTWRWPGERSPSLALNAAVVGVQFMVLLGGQFHGD